MKSFTNDVVNNWRVELDQDSTLRQFMPMLNFTLDNSGDSEVEVFLHGESVGSCYGYATFSVVGKPFESFRIEGVFNIGDLTVNVSKMEIVTAMPFNPQIDLMEENLDKFASGTDKRIAYSSAVCAEAIKYVLNANNSLVVQRKLDVLGGASVGSYEIDFSGSIISGSTAINFPSVDLKRYKKTIVDSTFDYTVTNCEIKGWLIDYYLNPNDASMYYTPVLGTNEVYDDDVTTYFSTSEFAGGAVNKWEVSFPERSINKAHVLCKLDCSGASDSILDLDLKIDGSWTTVETLTHTGTTETIKVAHNATGWDLVTGARFTLECSGASTAYAKIYDLSMF